MSKYKFAIILLAFPLNLSFAQNLFLQKDPYFSNSNKNPLISNLTEDFSSMYHVGKGFISNTIHLDSKDLMTAGIIVGVTAISTTFDNPIRDAVKKSHSSTLDRITPFGDKIGNSMYATKFCGVVYLGGFILGEDELRKTGLMLTEAMVLNGAVTQGLKIIMGRSRPYANEGNYDIDFLALRFQEEDYSLPSGHTSAVFTMATVLSERIDNIYASVGLYSLAGWTAFQRIYADAHWFSDTFLGAAIGTVIGLEVVKLNSEYETSRTNLSVVPLVNPNGYGVSITLNF
jgi:hypothetical protein